MIPALNKQLLLVETEVQPSLTYKIDQLTGHITGKIDDSEAMLQAIKKILHTERYSCVIYSGQYGVELEKLIGKDADFIKAVLKRTIEEALFVDDRIFSVTDFEITDVKTDSFVASFTVNTAEGPQPMETEVTVL